MKGFTYLICALSLSVIPLAAQEYDITGFEFSLDQDNLADFVRDSTEVSDNYTIALRLGIYGELANHPTLLLPAAREFIDWILLDNFLYNQNFREERRSHNFVFTINGFSPSHISDEIPEFQNALAEGYSLDTDRPFSSFTGFRSTRRLEGNKIFVHSARQLDFAINSSLTFGFAGMGLARGLDNLFGARRPDGNLWKEDDTKDYPTGQVNFFPMPLFMYSLSSEMVMWRPLKKVVLQLRPEVNLGYMTNIGLGIDFGKLMNVERTLDNLSYTDTHNPGILVVNNEHLSLAFSIGGTARAVLYNAHLSGWFGWRDDYFINVADTKKILLEAYAGFKLQLLKTIEINFSVNTRNAEFNGMAASNKLWGTFGVKYLIAEEGEGCYD